MYIYIINLMVIFMCMLFSKGKYNGKKFNKKMLYIIAAFQLIWVVALRDISIGADTRSYIVLNHYIKENISSLTELFSDWYINDYWRFEKGYSFYCYVLMKLGFSDQMFIFVNTLIAVVPVMVLIYKKSSYPLLSLLLFVIFGMYSYSFNVLRQYLAIGLISIAYLLYENEEKKYLAIPFVIGAILLHNSAIIVVAMLLTRFIERVTPVKSLVAYVGFIGFFVLGRYILGNLFMQFDKYNSQSISGQNNIMTILAFLAIFIYLVMINNGRFFNEDKDYIILLYMYIIMQTAGMFVGIMARFSLYFYVGAVVGIPNLLLRKRNMCNISIMLIVILMFSIQYFRSLAVDRYLVPYLWGI